MIYRILFIITIFIANIQIEAAPISAASRRDLLSKEAIDICFNKNKSVATGIIAISDERLKDYCICQNTKIADTLTAEDERIFSKTGDKTIITKAARIATDYCTKKAFSSDFIRTCSNTLRSNNIYDKISDKDVNRYCKCASDRTTLNLTIEDFVKAGNGDASVFIKPRAAAEAYCNSKALNEWGWDLMKGLEHSKTFISETNEKQLFIKKFVDGCMVSRTDGIGSLKKMVGEDAYGRFCKCVATNTSKVFSLADAAKYLNDGKEAMTKLFEEKFNDSMGPCVSDQASEQDQLMFGVAVVCNRKMQDKISGETLTNFCACEVNQISSTTTLFELKQKSAEKFEIAEKYCKTK